MWYIIKKKKAFKSNRLRDDRDIEIIRQALYKFINYAIKAVINIFKDWRERLS